MGINMTRHKIKLLLIFALSVVVLNMFLFTWNKSLKVFDVPYLVNTPVNRVAFDKQGRVWVSGGGKLSVYKDGIAAQVFTKKDSPALGGDIRALEVDDRGRAWIAPQGNERTVDLAFFDGTKWSTLLLTPDTYSLSGHVEIRALAIDSQGRVWIGTETQIFYNIDSNNWKHIPIASKFVTCIVFDNQGRAWIGGDGLYIFDGENWQIFTTDNSPLLYGGVHAITFDQQGRAWVASGQAHGVGHGGGVSVFDGENWISYPDISEGGFEDIAIDGAGRVWAMQGKEGTLVFDGESWKNHKFSVGDAGRNLATDEDGNVWIPTQKNGVTFIPSDPRKYLSPQANIISLVIASHGLIYLNIFLIGIWLYFSINAWRSTGLGLADLQAYFALSRLHTMNRIVATKFKARDIAIGLFGWVIFHNIYFILVADVAFSLSDGFVSILLGLPFVIVLLVLIAMKKYWICMGSVIAILTTIGIWLLFGGFKWWALYLLPFPTGIYALMQ
jgi:streptogramin lyase